MCSSHSCVKFLAPAHAAEKIVKMAIVAMIDAFLPNTLLNLDQRRMKPICISNAREQSINPLQKNNEKTEPNRFDR